MIYDRMSISEYIFPYTKVATMLIKENTIVSFLPLPTHKANKGINTIQLVENTHILDPIRANRNNTFHLIMSPFTIITKSMITIFQKEKGRFL